MIVSLMDVLDFFPVPIRVEERAMVHDLQILRMPSCNLPRYPHAVLGPVLPWSLVE